uniref:Uncharacterized protein n=1 Tax=Azospirillum baldaniorum TaxID=1064539 RepID=D5LH87_9PROT|nr:hypothetical protein [Azospirillum baldaniorum]
MADPTSTHASDDRLEPSPEDAEVIALLDRLIGHEVAIRFADCCRIASGATGLIADLPLLSHGMRELESLLRESLLAVLDLPVPPPAGAAERVADIRRLQADKCLTKDEADTLDRRISGDGRHRREITTISTWMELPEDIKNHWLAMAIAQKKGESVHLTRFAHGRSYRERKATNAFFINKVWTPFKLVFREILLALERRYARLYTVVDGLSASTDRVAAAREFADKTPFPIVLQRRFFSGLHTNDWLPALRDNGLFAEPPPAVAAGRQMDWPAGEFLLRLARNTDAATLAQIIEIVQPLLTSQNPVVHSHLTNLAHHLPGAAAAAIAARIPDWLGDATDRRLAYRAAQLVRMIAEGDEGHAAIALAAAVFAVKPSATAFERIQTVLSPLDYAYLLEQAARPLARVAGPQAVALFAGLLVRAGEAFSRMSAENGEDFSAVLWLQRIDALGPGQSSVIDGLTLALRDACLEVTSVAPEHLADVIAVVDDHRYALLRRIALHVLAQHTSAAPTLATAWLCNPDLLHSKACRIEYGALATVWFPHLSEEEQTAILDSVQHPPAAKWNARRAQIAEQLGRSMTDKEESIASDLWFRDRVHAWRSVLPPPAVERLENIVARYGAPSEPGIPIRSAEEASDDDDQLRHLSPAEVVAFVQEWREPSDGPRTEAHLARNVAEIVKEAPGPFASEAAGFADLRPLVLVRYLEGMRDAAQNGLPVAGTLLDLAERVARGESPQSSAGQPVPEVERRGARIAVAELFAALAHRPPTDRPANAAERIVSVLIQLLDDPSPTPDEENDNPMVDRDPCLVAMTTVRGAAVNALLWCAIAARQPESQLPGLPALLPTIMHALEQRLDPQTEPSRCVRSVFGAWLSRLSIADPTWVTGNLRRILPVAPDEDLHWRAAWAGFVRRRFADGQILDHVRDDFVRAIDAAADGRAEDHEAEMHLANRLADCLWNGTIGADDELLQRFLSVASKESRRDLLRSFGIDLPRTGQANARAIPADLYQRLQAYLDLRLAAVHPGGGFEHELEGFGPWIDRPGFDPAWVLRSLDAVLAAGALPEYPTRTLDWLAAHCTVSPAEGLRCLQRVLQRLERDPDHQYVIDYAEASIRPALAAALADPALARTAGDVVGWLLAHGHDRYADLHTPQ